MSRHGRQGRRPLPSAAAPQRRQATATAPGAGAPQAPAAAAGDPRPAARPAPATEPARDVPALQSPGAARQGPGAADLRRPEAGPPARPPARPEARDETRPEPGPRATDGLGPRAADGLAPRATCTAAQLRRFIKSRPWIPLHELRRRFGISGPDDEVTPVRVAGRTVFVGLPATEGGLLGELFASGDVGYELSLDPDAPIVVGVYPMRPAPRG